MLFSKNRLGLALGGGATKGMAVFGIIEEFEKHDIEFDVIAGTSVGAIIGAFYALHGEVTSLKENLLGFEKKDWNSFADFSLMSTKSLIKAEKYREFLKNLFGDKSFEETKIPLIVTATNLNTGKPEYIQKGKILDAVLASSSYPGIFPPHEINGDLFVDGGVLNNLPFDVLLNKQAERVIAINLGLSDSERKNKFNNLFQIISRSMDLMIENAFKQINHQDANLFIFEPKFKKGFNSSWDIDNLQEKYELGVEEFAKRKKDFFGWL